MRRTTASLIAASLAVFAGSASAATYPGNLNAGFGGAIGNGSLTLTDDGTTISGTLTRGLTGNFNDALVIYIDSKVGGFTDTSGFADGNDENRRAISGFDGGTNRSTLTFPVGFVPDYAISMKPTNTSNFGGLWQLANGGNLSLPFVASVGLTPNNSNNALTYNFSFGVSQIGLTAGVPFQTFNMVGTYIAQSGFRSTEAIAGNTSGTQGHNPFTVTAVAPYTTIPEPTTFAALAGAGLLALRRRK